jgi:peptide/nickel transport system permease protein
MRSIRRSSGEHACSGSESASAVVGYILRRLAWTVVVLWAIATLTFGAIFLSPIDPARSYAGARAPAQVVEHVRTELGLDQPLYVQYERYFGRLVRGNLGDSFETEKPVLQSILDALPNTVLLAFAALLVQVALGIPLGLLAAVRRGGLVDRSVLVLSLFGVATPTFVLGVLLLYFFAFRLAWFPLGGSGSFSHLVLPALTLGVAGAAWYARMLRSTALNILSEDYVRMARAKGMPERVVIGRHVLRNAISPIVTMVGLDFGVFLGGVLVIEKVFGWPGIGQQAWLAINYNDIPMVMGTVLVAAFFVTLFNLLADVVNAVIDPRVAYA